MGQTGKTFSPDDTVSTMYLYCCNMDLLWERVQAKWPGITMEEVSIDAENIQTSSINYDLHQSCDYTNFTVVKANDSYFKRLAEEGSADTAPHPIVRPGETTGSEAERLRKEIASLNEALAREEAKTARANNALAQIIKRLGHAREEDNRQATGETLRRQVDHLFDDAQKFFSTPEGDWTQAIQGRLNDQRRQRLAVQRVELTRRIEGIDSELNALPKP